MEKLLLDICPKCRQQHSSMLSRVPPLYECKSCKLVWGKDTLKLRWKDKFIDLLKDIPHNTKD